MKSDNKQLGKLIVILKKNHRPQQRTLFPFLTSHRVYSRLLKVTCKLCSLSGSLFLLATEGASLDARGGRELDVLLGGDADHEGGNVHHLFADSDVLLSDEDAGVVD